MDTKNVMVVLGVGGIGLAIARRLGAGRSLVLADIDARALQGAAAALESAGYTVTTAQVDVSSRASVQALAATASALGDITAVVHTAGVSPNMAPPDRILAVDLLGTALVLEEFGRVIARGGAAVVISSMAGHMLPPLPAAIEEVLARRPADELLALDALQPAAVPNSAGAYSIAKRANHLRVQAESLRWGERGARVNAISPGIVMTALAQTEMSSPIGDIYRSMIAASAAKRVGTADEVAAAAAYLLGPEAGFITGTDLLMDGGVIAALRAGLWGIPRG